jgi:hypothetical protein
MRTRYTVHAPNKGVPPLGSVMTPHMTRTYAGWSSRGRIHGAPGTQMIPAPDPAAIREDVNSLAAVGQFSTAAAPNAIYPSIYYENDAPLDKEKFPGSVFSDNQMPVPALRPGHKVPAKVYVARHGGQAQVVQPQVVQRFPKWVGMGRSS